MLGLVSPAAYWSSLKRGAASDPLLCDNVQLTVNFVALVVAFVAAVGSGETPLNVLQLLWVNLIMDSLGALGACLVSITQFASASLRSFSGLHMRGICSPPVCERVATAMPWSCPVAGGVW